MIGKLLQVLKNLNGNCWPLDTMRDNISKIQCIREIITNFLEEIMETASRTVINSIFHMKDEKDEKRQNSKPLHFIIPWFNYFFLVPEQEGICKCQ